MPTQAEAATLAAPRDECTTAVPSGDVAFHSQVAHLRSSPPDQAIWSAGLDAALAGRRLFTHGGRTVSSTAITALWGRLYGKSSRGVVMTTAEQLADLTGLSERQTLTGLAVMRGLRLISCDAPRRGFATRVELQPGGMTWLMARRVVATAVASNRAADVAAEPAPRAPDTKSPSPDMRSPPWVHEGLSTRPVPRARYENEKHDELHELPPGTTSTGTGGQTSDSAPATTPAGEKHDELHELPPGTTSTGTGGQTSDSAPATTPAGEKHDELHELPPGTTSTGTGGQTSDSAPATTPAGEKHDELHELPPGTTSTGTGGQTSDSAPATTPVGAPAIAPPSTAAQRLYAADLGVSVDDLDIGQAGHAIAAARVRRFVSDAQTATAAQEAARGRRAPQTRAGAGRARLANRFVGGHPTWPPGSKGAAELEALEEKMRRERDKQDRDPAFVRSRKRASLEESIRGAEEPMWRRRLPKTHVEGLRQKLAELKRMTDEEVLKRYPPGPPRKRPGWSR